MTATEISGGQLRAFLRSSGWEELPDIGPAGESWVKPGHEEAPSILVPRDPADRDFAVLIRSAITRLGWATGLPERDLLSRIVTTTTDILELCVVDPTTITGRIGLERGAILTQALRTVVMNGARLQFAGGKTAYTGILRDNARKVVDRLELAPPSAGSFRLEVFAPPPQLSLLAGQGIDDQSQSVPADPVHETLASALRAVDALRHTTEDEIPDQPEALEDAVSSGVSANLVTAMKRLDTQSSALKVVFRGQWAQPDGAAPDMVVLEAGHFARLPKLEMALKQYEPKRDYQLQGWVQRARAVELALDVPVAGSVVVDTGLPPPRYVHVELSGSQLQEAAAGIGSRYLNATGTLERVGRDWYLTDARNVRISDA
jgi:hypothetical protein